MQLGTEIYVIDFEFKRSRSQRDHEWMNKKEAFSHVLMKLFTITLF